MSVYFLVEAMSRRRIDGDNLRDWRRQRGMSTEALARELGVSYTTVSRWQTNKNKTGISPMAWKQLQQIGYQC